MSADPSVAELLQAARELARLGASTARAHFGNVVSSRKADNTPVTLADHAAQEAILATLSARYPGHAVLVEEVVAHPQRHARLGDCEHCWVVDPLDGTRNFSRGVGVYATSVAVLRNGRPIAGAVYDASADVTYSAGAGMGAFRGASPIRQVDAPVGPDTTVAVSSFRRTRIPAAVRDWLDVYLFRNLGSVCLHLAWVASGLMDAAYSRECKLWDVAAAALIIEEAGGVVTTGTGGPLWPRDPATCAGEDLVVLAGTPTIHARLLETLRRDG